MLFDRSLQQIRLPLYTKLVVYNRTIPPFIQQHQLPVNYNNEMINLYSSIQKHYSIVIDLFLIVNDNENLSLLFAITSCLIIHQINDSYCNIGR
jgi:hypothetical protein